MDNALFDGSFLLSTSTVAVDRTINVDDDGRRRKKEVRNGTVSKKAYLQILGKS